LGQRSLRSCRPAGDGLVPGRLVGNARLYRPGLMPVQSEPFVHGASPAILRDRFLAPFVGTLVSKHDDQFFNVFSAVLGLLIAITIGIFIFARILGGSVSETQVADDPLLQRDVAERIKPFGQVAVAGQDNSAMTIAPPPGAEAKATAAALPANGEETYHAVCAACHGAGVGGAPKFGDKAAWAPRIAQGADTLHKHAIEGLQGKAGYMPAKGGRADLPDELVMEAVDYMVAGSR
jgi:cytochrome c5